MSMVSNERILEAINANLQALWGHASSGHTKTYKLSIATAWLKILTPNW